MAEARVSLLLGGYDEEFVNEVEDELQCAICQLPLNEPILTKCGHRFCRRCLDEHFKRLENDRQQFSCPVDRISLLQDKDIFADKATERKILSLIIKCGSEGCQWTGELRSKENHLASCPMAIISCPYDQMGCTAKVQRREVESHLQFAMILHLGLTCAKLNNMQGEFKEMTRKLEEKYEKNTRRLEEKFGETKRELEEKHEEVTRKLEDKVNVLENRLMQFPEEYTWKISRFSKVQSQAKSGEKTSIDSPPFYYFGYKFSLWFHPNGYESGEDTHLSLYFHLMKGEYDARLSWPFQGKVKFTLIDQEEDASDRINIVKTTVPFPQDKPKIAGRPLTATNVGWGFANFVFLTKLTERRYIVDDTIVIQVQVVPE